MEYIPNQIHIPCDCSECVKNEEVLERLKKLIEDKKWYGRDATVEELQKILGEDLNDN